MKWDDINELFVCQGYLDSNNIKESFEDYLNDRRKLYPELGFYKEFGSWRNGDIIKGEESNESLSLRPNQCYYNCQTQISPTLSYVEGYAVSKKGKQAVPHAWLEYDDGRVVESTPTIPVDETLYYGVKFENIDVTKAMIDLEQADPIVEYMIIQGKFDKYE